jgi:hypothetical protein
MANLQVNDIDAKLYESIRELATNEKRSISQEVVYILQKYLSKPQEFDTNPTDEFLNLAGRIIDDMDLLIGSTALTHNQILVTNNVSHFERIEGLEIENWTE